MKPAPSLEECAADERSRTAVENGMSSGMVQSVQ